MTHPADDIQKEIHDLVSASVTEDAADEFEHVLFEMRDMSNDGVRHELVRLMQKWVAST